MNTKDFNAEASTPQYTYRKSPVHQRGFMIMKYKNGVSNDPVAVGDYIVLDSKEDPDLSEKKVINLVSLLNGRKNLMQLGHETGMRILYNVVTRKDDDGKARVVFYNLGKEGVSVENAMLRIEEDNDVI